MSASPSQRPREGSNSGAGTTLTADGRMLAYAVTGETDGVPLLYFHGLPGSRLDFARPFGQQALSGSGARLIGIDRPGFGRSDFQRRRRFEDWPADAIAVADDLGIERFGVLGYSCGAPYVVACARAFPERLSFAGIVSGVGPAEMPRFRDGLGKTDSVMTRLAGLAPPLARLAIHQASRTAERKPEKFSRELDKELSEPDLQLHSDPELRQAFREIFLESTRNGPRGVAHEYRISGRRWGFPFEEVEFPVHLWHGDLDALVPLAHAQYVAGRLCHATLTVLPGAGHLHPAERWREFFGTAAMAARGARADQPAP